METMISKAFKHAEKSHKEQCRKKQGMEDFCAGYRDARKDAERIARGLYASPNGICNRIAKLIREMGEGS